MKIYASTQTGRQYLLCYAYQVRHLVFIRVDTIRKVVPGNVEKKHEVYAGYFNKFRDHLWGVSIGPGYSMDHIEMTIHVDEGEGHIPQRLEREKRNGRVEQIDETHISSLRMSMMQRKCSPGSAHSLAALLSSNVVVRA